VTLYDTHSLGIDYAVESFRRPPLECPGCGRKGHVHRAIDRKVFIEHRCPGPWTVGKVRDVPGSLGGIRVTIYPTTDEQRRRISDAWPVEAAAVLREA
jgi:hypothetical protein